MNFAKIAADNRVLTRARVAVAPAPPDYSYVDVGMALVRYLRGEQDAAETLDTLEGLESDYTRKRETS